MASARPTLGPACRGSGQAAAILDRRDRQLSCMGTSVTLADIHRRFGDCDTLMQRYIDASILGWVNTLYGDRKAANARMLRDNPEMTEEELDASVALMQAQGIVDSGEARERGIRAMNSARIRDFHDNMVRAGLYKAGEVDLTKVADTRFVSRKVGLFPGSVPNR